MARQSQSYIPGITVDQDRFVVLHSRLGRRQEPLPKRNPDDEKEETHYFVPEAFERGEIISRDDIWEDPSDPSSPNYIDNIARLLKLRAIARLDDPEAMEAVTGLRYRAEQEGRAAAERGAVSR